MREVIGKKRVHTTIHELLFDIGIDDEMWVEIFFSQLRVFRDIS